MKRVTSYPHLFGGLYQNKRVLVTGHTGFKGSWLCTWLNSIGAEVLGFSLAPETDPNHYDLIGLNTAMESVIGDIKDISALKSTWREFQPEIVFHLAAQALVRLSYEQPIETLHTNIIGTANVLDVCRITPSVRAIVNITSDKCYQNREWVWGYRENDPMGGFDPYSVSKGCAELVTSAYRNSFFPKADYGQTHQVLLASARSGNVIGGGDWGNARLIPDLVRAISSGTPVQIRNPEATRPWQHVLEPLSGYLLLGQKLLSGHTACAQAFNFGPSEEGNICVAEGVRHFKNNWESLEYVFEKPSTAPHEAGLLKLDCSRSRATLGWIPVWNTEQAFRKTASWYKAYYEHSEVWTAKDLHEYIQTASNQGACWTRS